MAAQVKIGLDIGYTSIKAVVLSHGENPPRMVSAGHISSPQPGIMSEADLDLQAVAGSVKSLISEINPPTKDTIIALPENKIFTRVVYDLPFLTDEELAQAIRYAAEEFVPMPIPEVNLNYQIIFRSPKKEANSRTVVFVVATPKVTIDKYLRIMQMSDLKVIAIETEMIAAARALVSFNAYSPTTLVVQMGATNTDFAIVSDGLILLTRSIATGGAALTRAIAQSFNFENVQAEEYKKVYGLVQDQLEGKLFKTLVPVIDVVANEAKRVILAHETQNRQRPVKRVVLNGGGAHLPGLVSYFTNFLNLEVQEADPWAAINMDQEMKTKLSSEGAFYSVAVGLAMKQD